MPLRAREQAATRVCFDAEPSEKDLTLLGEPDRWRMYRHMVRTRIEDMVGQGLKRTRDTLGDDAFHEWVGRWLAAAPPASRYIRDVVLEFGAFAAEAWVNDDAVPPPLRELARYETHRWRLVHGESKGTPEPHGPFAFEGVPVWNPDIELLSFAFPVQRTGVGVRSLAPRETELLLYRRRDNHNVGYVELTPVDATLVRTWRADRSPMTESTRTAAAGLGIAIDPTFVEHLGTFCATLLERTILLGSAEPSSS
ncbi:MAG: putative DNA-binding domain-containing protein [Polyangiales bacterium]